MMSLKRVCPFFGLIVILAVGGGVAPPAAQAVITGTTTQVTTDAAVQRDSSISGSLMVWTDFRFGQEDVFFKNGAGPEVRLTTADTSQKLSDVGGDFVVYSESPGKVRAFNVATNTDLGAISGEFDGPQNPRIDGAVVAYEVGPIGNPDIWITNLNTGTITPIAATDAAEQAASVSGSRVVYERHASDGPSDGDIVLYDLITGVETTVGSGPLDQRRPDIDGNFIVYDVQTAFLDVDLCLYDLTSGVTTCLARPGNQSNPHVSGDVVSFDDFVSGNRDIFLYHIPTGTLHEVTTGPSTDFLSDISGNRIVYTSNVAGNFDIWMYEFEIQLPEIAVAPVSHDFGDLAVGSSETTIVTVSNVGGQPLTLSDITMALGSNPAFDILSAPALPAVIAPGGTVDVSVRFTPIALGLASGSLDIASDDEDEGLVQVTLTGLGVQQPPTPSAEMAELLAFFDFAVAQGTLQGAGSGNSAAGRSDALRNMIAAAADLIAHGLMAEACDQLLEAYRRADGQPQPPDFVAGAARTELAQRIQSIRASLGCL